MVPSPCAFLRRFVAHSRTQPDRRKEGRARPNTNSQRSAHVGSSPSRNGRHRQVPMGGPRLGEPERRLARRSRLLPAATAAPRLATLRESPKGVGRFVTALTWEPSTFCIVRPRSPLQSADRFARCFGFSVGGGRLFSKAGPKPYDCKCSLSSEFALTERLPYRKPEAAGAEVLSQYFRPAPSAGEQDARRRRAQHNGESHHERSKRARNRPPP